MQNSDSKFYKITAYETDFDLNDSHKDDTHAVITNVGKSGKA